VYVHLIYANKFDMRRKARLVLSGQLTPPSNNKAYSGIVSLEDVRTVLFLAELNELQLCAADIAQAYLEANTKKTHVLTQSRLNPTNYRTSRVAVKH